MSGASGLRLYVLDGGLIRGYDASDLADDGAYNGRLVDLPAPCFLIRHPDGDLMWESGISRTRTDLEIGVDFDATLEAQLAQLELTPPTFASSPSRTATGIIRGTQASLPARHGS